MTNKGKPLGKLLLETGAMEGPTTSKDLKRPRPVTVSALTLIKRYINRFTTARKAPQCKLK